MDKYIKFMDELPLAVKIIFALPFLEILWIVYRLCKSIKSNNTLGILLAVVLLLVNTILWIVDIITLCLYEKVFWIDDFTINTNKKDDKEVIIEVENEDK